LINKEDIDKIFDAVRVEEVVSDYVTLKKRGVNMIGLCPFHDEKSPSFYVSPAKGIYKCFGCGKGGNGVNFVMEKESLSYPDALRALAKKYNIELVEQEQTPEQRFVQDERESLFVVSSFAQKHFSENLHATDEGKSIALGYFKERGFSNELIEKFQLGYSIDRRKAFTDAALASGHKLESLVSAGLTIEYAAKPDEDGQNNSITQASYADRFWGRVMFPIHNSTGRVIAFGGRTLRNDKKTAKYINSPETDIYHKSDVLYGIYFAKKDIIKKDNCYLVEGYTDVISMHQAGVENVVASSGTSLTVGQIKLIRRFTQNITILYDGDSAGVKASFRGIDLILTEGLNVKVLLFPDGEDPDSYSKKVSSAEFQTFIDNNSQDFIAFKIGILLQDAKNDPIKKAGLIKDIVASIALIPDNINRSVYVKECSQLMAIEEQILLNEVNKIRNANFNAPKSLNQEAGAEVPEEGQETAESTASITQVFEQQERKIIEMLICYGEELVLVDTEDLDQDKKHVQMEVSVGLLIILELQGANINFDNVLYDKIATEFRVNLEKDIVLSSRHFINHEDAAVRKLTVDLITTPYTLSHRWQEHGIHTTNEGDDLKTTVLKYVHTLQDCQVKKASHAVDNALKTCTSDEELMALLQEKVLLDQQKIKINDLLGRIIVK
jgi:DNA primase